MAKNVPNVGKETDIQVQEAQRVLNQVKPKRPAPIQNLKIFLKQSMRKTSYIQGIPCKSVS